LDLELANALAGNAEHSCCIRKGAWYGSVPAKPTYDGYVPFRIPHKRRENAGQFALEADVGEVGYIISDVLEQRETLLDWHRIVVSQKQERVMKR
jgi:hypothetical protein